MSSGGSEGEEKDVPGGLPLATSPFFAPVDELLDVGAVVTLKRIASHFATK